MSIFKKEATDLNLKKSGPNIEPWGTLKRINLLSASVALT